MLWNQALPQVSERGSPLVFSILGRFRLPNAGSGEEAARLGRLAGVLLARVGGEALPKPQGLVGTASNLDITLGWGFEKLHLNPLAVLKRTDSRNLADKFFSFN